MGGHRRRWSRTAVVVSGLSVALVAPACTVSWRTASAGSASAPGASPSSGPSTTLVTASASLQCPPGEGTGAPGVTDHSIDVAAISTLSGTLAVDFGPLVPGMEAYFKMVNARGGVDGRTIDLVNRLDDGGNPSQFSALTHAAIDQDHAFAVGVSTFFFNPEYFVQTCTPTYGYNVTGNWSGAPNLYAAGGSVQDYNSLSPAVAYLIKQTKVKSVALLAYGVSSSADACKAVGDDLTKAGYDVSYSDFGLPPINADLSSDVQRIQSAGSDFILSCMDINGNISLARDMKQYGLKHITQLWLSGNDQNVLDQYKNLMQGVYFYIGHVPFQAAKEFPGAYPGLTEYLNAMEKYEPQDTYNELAVDGWMSAAALVDGIRAAGKDLTQANVIAETNRFTNFTADGLTSPVNWSTGHTANPAFTCGAVIQVRGDVFEPVFTRGSEVFTCVAEDVKNPHRIAPPIGTPGATGSANSGSGATGSATVGSGTPGQGSSVPGTSG